MPDPQELVQESTAQFGSWISDFLSNNLWTIVLTVVGAITVFVVGRWLAMRVANMANRWILARDIEPTAAKFLSRAVYVLALLVVIVVALSVLGVPMASFVALIGASALAIGLALQDSLSNLASGLLLVILKPYGVGDFVEVGDDRVSGTVEEVQFFHTLLRTIDNSVLLVPNREVMNNPIQNYTEVMWRRVDMEFGIGYDDDLLEAKRILTEVATADPRVLADPPIRVAVKELGDNSVNLILQPYVLPIDYLGVKYDLTERVKLRFDEAGITIPYPQRTVYVVQ